MFRFITLLAVIAAVHSQTLLYPSSYRQISYPLTSTTTPLVWSWNAPLTTWSTAQILRPVVQQQPLLQPTYAFGTYQWQPNSLSYQWQSQYQRPGALTIAPRALVYGRGARALSPLQGQQIYSQQQASSSQQAQQQQSSSSVQSIQALAPVHQQTIQTAYQPVTSQVITSEPSIQSIQTIPVSSGYQQVGVQQGYGGQQAIQQGIQQGYGGQQQIVAASHSQPVLVSGSQFIPSSIQQSIVGGLSHVGAFGGQLAGGASLGGLAQLGGVAQVGGLAQVGGASHVGGLAHAGGFAQNQGYAQNGGYASNGGYAQSGGYNVASGYNQAGGYNTAGGYNQAQGVVAVAQPVGFAPIPQSYVGQPEPFVAGPVGLGPVGLVHQVAPGGQIPSVPAVSSPQIVSGIPQAVAYAPIGHQQQQHVQQVQQVPLIQTVQQQQPTQVVVAGPAPTHHHQESLGHHQVSQVQIPGQVGVGGGYTSSAFYEAAPTGVVIPSEISASDVKPLIAGQVHQGQGQQQQQQQQVQSYPGVQTYEGKQNQQQSQKQVSAQIQPKQQSNQSVHQ